MDSVKKRIEELTGCEVQFDKVFKGNSYKPACKVMIPNSAVIKVIYYNPDKSEDEIVDEIVTAYNIEKESNIGIDICEKWTDMLSSKDAVLQNVYPILMNGDIDIDPDIVFLRYLDLRVAYRIINEEGSAIIRKAQLEHFQITPEELHEASVRNVSNILVVDDMLRIMGFPATTEKPEMVVITNKFHQYGAGGLISKDAIEKVKTLLGSDRFYILPSSIHEIICVSADINGDINDLQQMIKEVNGSDLVSDDEYLSDTLYIYEDDKTEVAS